MTLPLLTDQKESPGITFAEPDDSQSVGQTVYKYGYGALVDPIVNPQAYKDIFTTAERSTRLTGNMVSETASREEAYDRRIAAVKKSTGIDLENPERGGYAIDARKAIRDEVRAGGLQPIDAKGGIPEYQKRIFDQKIAALQKDHPDLDFGDVGTEARTLAKGAADAAAKAAGADVNPVASLATGFAGALVGSRRDPLFIGSMFAGPTSAVGKTAFARIATSSLFQGLFNAGVSAVEQPTVQDWRGRIGMESGVIPALHEVGAALFLGMIPGALIQGGKEAFSVPLRRVLAGHPEPGDVEAVHAGLTPAAPREAAALAAGAESVAADRATLTIPEPKGVDPALHNDMLAAALKRADDPAEPSPEAVAFINAYQKAEPASGMVRMYRVDRLVDDMPKSQRPTVPDWMKSTDYYRDMVEAEGRWFAADRENIEWYINAARRDGETPKVSYIDVPQGDAEAYRVSKLPEGSVAKEFSRLPEQEFFVPRELANQRKEIEQRITEAAPKSEREAVAAADEALDDIGRRESAAVLRDSMDAAKAEQDAARAARVAADAIEPAPKPARGDVMGKIPWLDDSGNPKLLTPKAAAAIGERDDLFAMLVRSCK